MTFNFTKMHGLGNDFVLIDSRSCLVSENAWPQLAQRLSDRKFGIGCDQVLLLKESSDADFRMDIYNADGSRVEMCGNGIRCFAKYLKDNGLCQSDSVRVETLAGVIVPRFKGGLIEVDMGPPIFDGRKIPVAMDGEAKERVLEVNGRPIKVTCLSMGNPHAVIFVENAEAYPVEEIGPLVERHDFFPNKVNVEFVEIRSSSNIRMRVWERGSGLTMACGTGASASAVACMWTGRTGNKVDVELDGGTLSIRWDGVDSSVFMTGPAETVFCGEITL